LIAKAAARLSMDKDAAIVLAADLVQLDVRGPP